ncbi:MAG: SAM-dependent methyltransferase [Burkholderiales bacterium]|nr:SAM-dependent methyltransferase [Burkholderiales bacterium]
MEYNKQILASHKVQQFINNVRVIEEMAKSEPNLEVLKSYQGFGGLKRCFWDKTLYGQIMRAIRANFGAAREKEVLESLRNSSSSAYYTPKEVINFIYRYVSQVCKFTVGDILEPSCGNGAFFEYMPNEIRSNSTITGVEYDTLTAKLVQSLYPDVAIINDGLQNIDFSGKKYDLIVGNPPYSAEKITDSFMPDLDGYSIHHYFVAKCMCLLKDNGIMALVVPSFYMDIPKANKRHIINNEAVVVDVVRLPDNLFEQATVTVDIIFIRKTGNKIHDITETIELVQGKAKDSINKFWNDNQNRVLGELKLKWVECYKRHVPTCAANDKEQALRYLNLCEFTQSTIENYQKIISIKSDSEMINISKVDYGCFIGEISDVFIEIEELEIISRNLQSRLNSLLEKAWKIIEAMESKFCN